AVFPRTGRVMHTTRSLSAFLGGLGLAALLAAVPPARTQEGPALAQTAQNAPAAEDSQQSEGVEVLTRGPVHEAYAETPNSEPKATAVVAKKPPDPIEEMPPDQKPEGDSVLWIPGYWSYDEERTDYLW